MDDVKMMIVMPWKLVVGKMSKNSLTGVYTVKDAIIFDNAMTNQGVMIPIPNTLGGSELKGKDLNFTIQSVIVEPFEPPKELYEVYMQITSNLVIANGPKIIHG